MDEPARAHRRRAAELRARTATLGGAAAVFFGYPSPRLLASKLVVVLGARGWLWARGIPWSALDLWIVGAVALYWPFQEWGLHVGLLHRPPSRIFGITIDPLAARRHRAHHARPWDLQTAFLPLGFLVPLVGLNLAVWALIAPDLPRMLTGVAAMTAAALGYEWVHFLTHTSYRPRSTYLRWVVRRHLLHHFRNERYWHAFVVPWVDDVLGTAPDPATVPRSRTCRELGATDPP